MKILQIMPDFEMAGAQIMMENLVNELVKEENIHVEVVSFYNKQCAITERLEQNNIKIYYLNKRKGLDISIFFKIRKIIDEFNPDIIHTHRYSLEYIVPVLKLCNNSKIKIIHTIHNVAEKEVPKRLQLKQYHWFRRGNIIPVAISDEVKKSIKKRYKISDKKIPIIYNGIDLKKCIIKNNYKFNNKILHIGRFSTQKNHEELIKIFGECLKENKDLILYLVGDGELIETIKAKVKEVGISNNVIFKGKLENSYNILNECDLFVMPSKWEGMPMTLIEAMGTGLPCVAYPVGGIPDMIMDNENGLLANDSDEFISDVLELSNNQEKRELLGKNALKDSFKYSSSLMEKEYLKLYMCKEKF